MAESRPAFVLYFETARSRHVWNVLEQGCAKSKVLDIVHRMWYSVNVNNILRC